MKDTHTAFEHALMVQRHTQLAWVVRFAYLDLATLPPEDWQHLREDFLDFLGWDPEAKRELRSVDNARGGLMPTRVGPPYPEDFTEQDFRALQREVWTILRGAARDTLDEHPPCIEVKTSLVVVSLGSAMPRGGYVTNVIGPPRDLFLFLLLDILRQEPPDRILRCPDCQTLFVRTYGQVYCSRPCTNRAGIRAWRQRQALARQGTTRDPRQAPVATAAATPEAAVQPA